MRTEGPGSKISKMSDTFSIPSFSANTPHHQLFGMATLTQALFISLDVVSGPGDNGATLGGDSGGDRLSNVASLVFSLLRPTS